MSRLQDMITSFCSFWRSKLSQIWPLRPTVEESIGFIEAALEPTLAEQVDVCRDV